MMNTNFLWEARVKEAAAEALSEEWKGYVVQISGGNDKGFPWIEMSWPMAKSVFVVE